MQMYQFVLHSSSDYGGGGLALVLAHDQIEAAVVVLEWWTSERSRSAWADLPDFKQVVPGVVGEGEPRVVADYYDCGP